MSRIYSILDISANLAVEISAMATTSDKSPLDESTDQSFNLDHSSLRSLSRKKNRDGLTTERLISVSFLIIQNHLEEIIVKVLTLASNR